MKCCFWEWRAANGGETYRSRHDRGDLLDPNQGRRSKPIVTADELVGCTAESRVATCAATDWPAGIERCDAVGWKRLMAGWTTPRRTLSPLPSYLCRRSAEFHLH